MDEQERADFVDAYVEQEKAEVIDLYNSEVEERQLQDSRSRRMERYLNDIAEFENIHGKIKYVNKSYLPGFMRGAQDGTDGRVEEQATHEASRISKPT